MLKVSSKKKVYQSPKAFLEKYGDQMTHMKVGSVLYVTYYGARTRIQRTGSGSLDYVIEMGRERSANGM